MNIPEQQVQSETTFPSERDHREGVGEELEAGFHDALGYRNR